MLNDHHDALDFQTFSERGTDRLRLSQCLQTTGYEVEAQAQTGEFAFDIKCVRVPSLSITKYRTEGELRCLINDVRNRLLIVIPIEGGALFKVRDQEIVAGPQTIVITPSRVLSGIVTHAVREHVVVEVVFPDIRKRLAETLERPIHDPINFQITLPMDSSAGRALSLLVKLLSEGLLETTQLQSSPRAYSSLTESLYYLLLEQVWHNYSDAMDRNGHAAVPKHVERAIAYMRGNLAQPLTVEDIAAAANVSPRTLQQSFKQYKDLTPMAYLKELRMQAVHRELEWAQPGVSVSEVTRRWGFTHLGRFAAEYRERFGKAPSGTLRGL